MSLRWGNITSSSAIGPRHESYADNARAALHGYPDPGMLPARLVQLHEQIARAEELNLTPAELQIATFLPAHHSLREIAETLNVSRTTVKTHVDAIYAKLEVTTRSEAVEQLAQLRIKPMGGKHLKR